MLGFIKFFNKEKDISFSGTLLSEIPEKYNNLVDVALRVIRQDEEFDFMVKIEDTCKEKNTVKILRPMIGRNQFEIKERDKLEIALRDEKGVSLWECIKLEEHIVNGLELTELTQVKEMKRENRRGGFRVAVDYDLCYTHNDNILKGKMKDISVLGMKLQTSEKHNIGDVINFRLEEVGILVALILREVHGENKPNKNVYGCKFINDNKLIEKYVYDLQLKNLRNNRGRHTAT